MRLTTVPVQAVIITNLLLFSAIASQPVPDTAARLLRRGSILWDSSLVGEAIAAAAEAGTPERLLFTGSCLYRLQAIAANQWNLQSRLRRQLPGLS